MRCETCGNSYDKAFRLIGPDGGEHTFDSFECAIEGFAPRCAHCGCRIIGHGVESAESMYCCARCAIEDGVIGVVDRADPAHDAEGLRRASVALDEPSG